MIKATKVKIGTKFSSISFKEIVDFGNPLSLAEKDYIKHYVFETFVVIRTLATFHCGGKFLIILLVLLLKLLF